MRKQAKPIRYGKPCMTNLPPELGRMIIDAIRNPPPFDRTKLERDLHAAVYIRAAEHGVLVAVMHLQGEICVVEHKKAETALLNGHKTTDFYSTIL